MFALSVPLEQWRLQVLSSAIQPGNHIHSLSENNGVLEVQTTPDAYDPNLHIPLEKQINLGLSDRQKVSTLVKRMFSRAISVWWVIALAGLLIFDLYYRPFFQRRVSHLYRLIRGSPSQRSETIPSKKHPMDYLAGTFILLFLVYAAVFTPYVQQEPHIRSDGVSYHIWTHAIKSGDFSFLRYETLLNPTHSCNGYHTIPYVGPNSSGGLKLKCFLIHPFGVALIRLPLMIWFVDPDNQSGFSRAEHQISQLSAIIALLLIIIVATKILRHHKISCENIQLPIITVVFGAALYHYATYANSMIHIYTALGTMLFSLVTFVKYSKRDSLGYLFLLAALSLLFISVRLLNVFIVLFFWAFWIHQQGVKKSLPRILVSGFGVSGAIIVQLTYNYYVTSGLTISSYGNEGFIWGRPMFWSVLFSYQKGLVVYYPILAVTLLIGFVCKKTRILTLFYLGLILLYALIYGYWYIWDLGPAFGHRGFVGLAPLSIIILAFAFNEFKISVRIVFQVLCMFSALITVQLMSGYWQGTLPVYKASSGHSPDLWPHLLGLEGTPMYWHGFLVFVFLGIILGAQIIPSKYRSSKC